MYAISTSRHKARLSQNRVMQGRYGERSSGSAVQRWGIIWGREVRECGWMCCTSRSTRAIAVTMYCWMAARLFTNMGATGHGGTSFAKAGASASSAPHRLVTLAAASPTPGN